jgi:ABC-type glycerol-3-phosphate transport system substrate-binding protein
VLLTKNRFNYFHAFLVLFLSLILIILFETKAYADGGVVQDYAASLKEWQNSNIHNVNNFNLKIPAANFDSKSSDADINIGSIDGKGNILKWNNSDGKVSYSFDAPAEGLYNISIEYYITDTVQEPVERGVLINGKLPFVEANNFLFERTYQKDQYPFLTDSNGNDIHPKLNEVKNWSTISLTDRNSRYTEPFKFFFKKGKNEITLTGLNGNLAISKLIIKSPETTVDYETYKNNLPSGTNSDKFYNKLEAEDAYTQSGTNIQILNVSQPDVTPQVIGKKRFNTIGGTNWSNAHDWIEWKFKVPQDGIYNIALTYQQNFNANLSSYRKIEIDNKVPFKELLSVSFPYGVSWQTKVLGEHTPYDFYLTKGEHTIRLTVTNALYTNVQENLKQTVNSLRELDLRIQSIIGVNNVDTFRIWNLKQYIPELPNELKKDSEMLEEQAGALSKITGFKKSSYGQLLTAANDLKKLSLNVDEIPKTADSLSSIYTSITNVTNTLDTQPLLLDNLMFKSKANTFPIKKVSLLNRVLYFFKDFFASFKSGESESKTTDSDTVQVWVQRNKDYVNLMQEYADEYFTPKTGIKINVNYCPPGANLLVLANAAKKQPDIATGVDSYTTYSFAERGALVNLNQYSGYKDLKQSVVPSSLVPYHYLGGDYGFPEEIIYNVLYYRDDILKRYNLKVPQTWEDVIKDIPTLEEHNANVFYPYGDFQTFFAQNNVNVYSNDGMKVNFTSPEGYKAFQFWTDLYIKYGMPEQMTNFYQHFRQGDAPIGITTIDQYIMFELSAPDISGIWNIALAPGTQNQNGHIERWEAGTQNGVMMFKTNQKRQERAWQFLQWWLSTDTQTKFANDLQNYNGPEFMWYSANPSVIEQQNSWNSDVKKILIDQLKWYKPVPFVPGGSYMTPRDLWNAWTATVIDKENFRQQLESAARDIQSEMDVKQQEFGFENSKGKVVKTLDPNTVP